MTEQNGEVLTNVEQQNIEAVRGLIGEAERQAMNAAVLGERRPEGAAEPDPFNLKVAEFVWNIYGDPTKIRKPSTWPDHKLREMYEAFEQELPEDAPEEQRDAREKIRSWIRDSAMQKEERTGERGTVEYVLSGVERAQEPVGKIPVTGADPEDMERLQQGEERRRLTLQEQILADKAEALRRVRAREIKGELSPHERATQDRRLKQMEENIQLLSSPGYIEHFGSIGEIERAARAMAEQKSGAPMARTTDAELVSAETPEETEILPDYREEKQKLLQELRKAKTNDSSGTPIWDEYGWSLEEGRTEIRHHLQDLAKISIEQAEEVMAAALLHGETAESFFTNLQEAYQSRGRLVDYLEMSGIIRDDDDVLSIAVSDQEQKKDIYERLLVNRPGNFESTIWQQAHAPGANEGFREGNAMALYRNVVVRKLHKGQWRLMTEQRVNTDNVMEWLEDRMLEAHGNNTTRALDFENEVKIQKSGMGLPISVYDMMLARTEEMFKSQYLKDKDGNSLRFGWVADMYEAITNILAESRSAGIVIPQKMRGDIQELIAERLRTAIVSNMTRDIGGSSLSEQQRKLSEKGNGRHNADGKKGAVIDTCYIAYCSTYDTEKLAKVLGCERMDELGEIFNLKNLRSIRDGIVKNGLVDAKQKFRPEFRDNPDLWLSLQADSKVHGVTVKEVYDMETGVPIFLSDDPKYSPEARFKAEAKFRTMINFLNNMSPDARMERVVKRIITKKAKDIHGLAATIRGADVSWRDDLIEMQADGMMYRFGMYTHMDNKLEIDEHGHMHTGFSSRSEENKLNAGFREHYGESYASGGNRFNQKYFLNSLLPEAIALRTRKGEVYQNVIEDIVFKRLEISKQAKREAEERFDREFRAGEALVARAKQEGVEVNKDELGDVYKAYLLRIKKIGEVKSMQGREADIPEAAKSEIIAEEVSRILTTSTARKTVERQFDDGKLDAAFRQRRGEIARSEEMKGRSKEEIDAIARSKVIADEVERIELVTPETKKALISDYNEAAQELQFDGEVERTWGTENYKNSFNLARELAFKTLGLTESITQGPEGPQVKLEKFMDTFSKRATEITKSFKNLEFSKLIDAWDRYSDPPQMRKMTIAEYQVGPDVLAAMGLIGEGLDNSSEAIAQRIKEANGGKGYKPKDFAKWMMAALVSSEVELYREWAEWNLAPRYSFATTMTILSAIGKMPGGKDADGNWIPFFEDKHMDFIRGQSDTGVYKRYLIELLSNFLLGTRGKKDGFFSGIAELFSVMFKASFQGVATA